MEAEKTRVDVESAVQTVYLIAGITAVAMLGVEFVQCFGSFFKVIKTLDL